MPLQKISIEQFLELSRNHPVLDVRSPGEYNHAHIPDAVSVPLFNDEERKVVGTIYKQQNRESAIKTGLDFFGVKMKKMVEEVEEIVGRRQGAVSSGQRAVGKGQLAVGSGQGAVGKGQGAVGNGQHIESKLQTANCLLIHCWRGGMRSAAVAWLLDLYGFKIYTLAGGYKAYRKWVLAQFEKNYEFKIIGGYTGSGKTLLLHELKNQLKTTIDLEALANHKGSAFGALGELPQPKQEMFENVLAKELHKLSWPSESSHLGEALDEAFIEDESQRIGNLQIPMPLWNTMRNSLVYFLDIPFEERLDFITSEYGKFEKEKLVNAVIRIQKRLGGLETRNAVSHLVENNFKECFRILLTYYDKWYVKGLNNRDNLSSLLNKIPCKSVDTKTNAQKLIKCQTVAI